jgi:LPXTG-site transpeptidase (sortase) family protein
VISKRRRDATRVALAIALVSGAALYLVLPILLPKADASLGIPRVSSSDVATSNVAIDTAAEAVDNEAVADTQATAGATIPDDGNADREKPETRLGVRNEPKRISIDAIGVDARVIPVGIDSRNRSLVVPTDGSRVGWWNGGAPDDPMVLVGHVDSKKEAAVFFRLAELKPGDVIVVTDSTRADQKFRVRKLIRVEKDDFPTLAVYKGDPGLRIITCGGRFDRKTRHYEDNVIVFADPVTD